MKFYDESDEIRYKNTRRYACDKGKGGDSKGYIGHYGNKPKAKFLRKPFNRNTSNFQPAKYCLGCQHDHCGLVLLRRASYCLGYTTIYGIIEACK